MHGAFAVVLQQMESHALGRFDTDPRQAFQRLHQQFKGVVIGHGDVFFSG
jgi:hypothetical protein